MAWIQEDADAEVGGEGSAVGRAGEGRGGTFVDRSGRADPTGGSRLVSGQLFSRIAVRARGVFLRPDSWVSSSPQAPVRSGMDLHQDSPSSPGRSPPQGTWTGRCARAHRPLRPSLWPSQYALRQVRWVRGGVRSSERYRTGRGSFPGAQGTGMGSPSPETELGITPVGSSGVLAALRFPGAPRWHGACMAGCRHERSSKAPPRLWPSSRLPRDGGVFATSPLRKGS